MTGPDGRTSRQRPTIAGILSAGEDADKPGSAAALRPEPRSTSGKSRGNRSAVVLFSVAPVKRILKRWRWIVGGAATLLMLSLGCLWLMFQHIPAWYRPARVPLDQHQQIKNDQSTVFNDVGARLNNSAAPFQLRLTQDQVNAWLATREWIEPLSREWLPPSLQDPMLVMETGAIRMGVTYNDHGLRTVLSARVELRADREGIQARLADVSGGSIGVPDALVRSLLAGIDRQRGGESTRSSDPTDVGGHPALRSLLEGVTLPNTSRMPGGGHRFRVIGLDVQPGAVVFTLERLPDRRAAR